MVWILVSPRGVSKLKTTLHVSLSMVDNSVSTVNIKVNSKSPESFGSSRGLSWFLLYSKNLMQGKLFQRCTHLLYCSVLSMGGNVNTRRMSKSDMGSIFHINNQWNILVIGNYYVNHQNHQNLMLLASSDTKLTLTHLFLFTK